MRPKRPRRAKAALRAVVRPVPPSAPRMSHAFSQALAAWFLMCFPLLTTPCARWYLSWDGGVLAQFYWILLAGAAALFYVLRASGPGPAGDGSVRAWGWAVGVLVVLGLLLRLTRLDQPIGLFWIDQANVLMFARQVVDYGDRRLIFPNGSEGPLYVYSEALFMWLFPGFSDLTVLRLASALWDVLSILLFYLLGRELGGRRVGFWMAALGAVSRIMLFKCYLGVESPNLVTVTALALWVQVRLFREPSWARFLVWGAGVTVGMYAYPAYRPWLLFLYEATLAWVLWLCWKSKAGWPAWILAAGWALAGGISYCWAHLLLLPAPPRVNEGWGLLAAGSALLLAAPWAVPGLRAASYAPLRRWSAGVLVIAALFYPLARDPIFASRMQEMNDFHSLASPLGLLAYLWRTVCAVFQVWFVQGSDRPTAGPVDETFFSLGGAVFVLLGLVHLVARLDWKKGFLALCLVPALFPWVTISGAHTSRMLSCVVPLYALAALGFDRLWTLAGEGRRPAWARMGFAAAMAAFLAWTACANLRSTRHWVGEPGVNVIVSDQARKDAAKARVYLAFYTYESQSQDALLEGTDVLKLDMVNPIDLEPGQPKPDLVVLAEVQDRAVTDALKRQFPGAQWTLLPDRPEGAPGPFLERVFIPASQVPGAPGKLFYFQEAPAGAWDRRFYDAQYGTHLGILWAEDRTAGLRDPLPPGVPDIGSALCTLDWDVPASGEYRFSTDAGNDVRLQVDGRTIWQGRADHGDFKASRTLQLSAGKHRVSYWCFFRYGKVIPEVRVTGPGGPWAW